ARCTRRRASASRSPCAALEPSAAVDLPLFYFSYAPTTAIYTLSLHDALPIFGTLPHVADALAVGLKIGQQALFVDNPFAVDEERDRKSTRLNSSHQIISYAVFCLKKKKQHFRRIRRSNAHTALHLSRHHRPHK